MYFKLSDNGYVVSYGRTTADTNNGEITESEYNTILSLIHNRPTASTGFTYKLKADTLTWELVELPPIEEDDEATESDYITALQDLGVTVE